MKYVFILISMLFVQCTEPYICKDTVQIKVVLIAFHVEDDMDGYSKLWIKYPSGKIEHYGHRMFDLNGKLGDTVIADFCQDNLEVKFDIEKYTHEQKHWKEYSDCLPGYEDKIRW